MNQLTNLKITIFGGTGFLGRHLIKHLCNDDCIIKVPTRNPAKAYFLQPSGDVGQISAVKFNLSDHKQIKNLIDDADIIINLIGILFEKKKNEFEEVHFNFVKKLVDSIDGNKKIFLNLSSLGVDKCKNSLYASSKLKAENYIQKKNKKYSIIRPSLIFGPEDDFFNKFAQMSLFSPFLPLVMGGNTKFQPVYVDDVCKGIVEILKKNKLNKIYEFGGPNIYSFKELMLILLDTINRKRLFFYIPKKIAIFMSKFFELFPKPLLTQDQIKLLEVNNIVLNANNDLKSLKINPTSLEMVLPDYLKRFKKY